MRSSRRWPTAALALALLAGAAAPLAAQQDRPETEDDDQAGACACVDDEQVRARTREAMARAREAMEEARRAMRQARRQAVEVRRELVSRPRLGVGVDERQPDRVDSLGVRVTRVPEEGPAGRAGLREGDVIVAVDGRRLVEPLADADEEGELDRERSLPVQRLVRVLREHEPGDRVEVTYRRDGTESTTTVELAAPHELRGLGAPEPPVPPVFRFRGRDGPDIHPPPAGPGYPRRPGARRGPALMRWREVCRDLPGQELPFPAGACVAGLQVAELNPELGEYFGTAEGVLVTAVAEGVATGPRPGDVILGVGERSVEDVDDLARILGSYEDGEEISLRLRRAGRELEVTGAVP